MNTDPRETLSSAPMSALQIVVVAITVGLTALDGFDVLSIAFAATGIAAEWGIDRGALGIVLAMELIGMALGSIVLGGLADRIGRRPTMLGCLLLMTLGMFMVTAAKQILELEVWRFITGLGIGGLLASSNAVAAEFSNLRRRNLCVALMAAGYPVGGRHRRADRQRAAARSRLAVGVLFRQLHYRTVHPAGVAASFPSPCTGSHRSNRRKHWSESTKRSPAWATRWSQRCRLFHPPCANRSVGAIFAPALIMTTVLATLAYFFHIMTF